MATSRFHVYPLAELTRGYPSVLAALVLMTAVSPVKAVPIEATLTADNHYGLYHGQADGSGMTLVGRNEFGDEGNPGGANWSLPETYTFVPSIGDHLYVLAWNDGGPQMWIGQFNSNDRTLLSNLVEWEFFVSGGPNPGRDGPLPPLEQVASDIANRNWSIPQASHPHDGTRWFDTFPGISLSAEIVWHDTLDGGSSSDDAYVIFRTTDPVRFPLTGDVNADGVADNLDITSFLLALSAGHDDSYFQTLVPGGDLFSADTNLDGFINNLDITPFIEILSSAASGSVIPEPAVGVLLFTMLTMKLGCRPNARGDRRGCTTC